MPEFELKSRNKLIVSMAAFEDGNDLRKAVMRCMAKAGLDGFQSEEAVQQLLCDNDVERLMFSCAQAAIYAGAKVDKKLFDDPKLAEDARGDYFEIVSRVLGVNLNPFFRQASLQSGTTSPSVESGQTLK